MSLACAVSVRAAAAVLAGAVAAASPSPTPDVVPVLTSTPFGAGSGQPVSHAITLSGRATGTVAVRVTFTTTIGLDGLAGTTPQGHCQVTDPRTVVCELRLPATDLAAAKIVVTGMMPPDAPGGALVQNWVSSHLEQGATGPADGVTSNAYLIPTNAPPGRTSTAVRRAASGTRPGPVLVAVVIGLAAALAGLTALRRFRRRRS